MFALRLSPLLPIPIGGYTYLYAMASVKLRDFMAGMALGSIKPYALDCYLGSLISSTLLQASTVNGVAQTVDVSNLTGAESNGGFLSTIVLVTILIVGTLSTQLFSDTYQEISTELQALTNSVDPSGDGASSKKDTGLKLVLKSLGVTVASLPKTVQNVLQDVEDSWERVHVVIEDEVRSNFTCKNDAEQYFNNNMFPLVQCNEEVHSFNSCFIFQQR